MTKTVDHSIPDRYVGLMIGKGGDSISRLQDESGAKIQISPESSGPQRQVTITGTSPQIDLAKQLMENVLLSAEKSSSQFSSSEPPDGQTVMEVPVPGPKVGLVIGKNGETIKSLQERAGVRMYLIQDSSTASLQDKPLRITGPPDKLQAARDLVMELLNSRDGKEFPPSGRGPDDTFEEMPVPRRCVGVVIGKGGDMLRKINRETGARVQFRQEGPHEHGSPERMLQVTGDQQSVQLALERVRHLINAVMSGEIPVTDRPRDKHTATCQVPADKAGLVIGKGGETVKEINRTTGAYVSIQREPPPNDSVKIFDIQGSTAQISEATRLICEKAGIPHDYGQQRQQQQQQQPQQQQQQMPVPQYNSHTGQMDYSAAWAEYYRRQGLNEYADAILLQAQQPQEQWQQWQWQQWQNGQQPQPQPQQQQQHWSPQQWSSGQGAGWEQAAGQQEWSPSNGSAQAAGPGSWPPGAWGSSPARPEQQQPQPQPQPQPQQQQQHLQQQNWWDATAANRPVAAPAAAADPAVALQRLETLNLSN